jgi:3-oxoacyl-[acyl-carrier-protein] synthase II
MKSNRRRVVITGIGAVTPIGNTMSDTWNGVIEGRKSVGKTTVFDAKNFPCDFSYQVSDFSLDERGFTDPTQKSFLNRAAQFGWNAAHEALDQSRILQDTSINKNRFSVCLGVGMGCEDLSWYAEVLPERIATDESVLFYTRNYPSTLTTMLAALTGARGGNTTVHTACASSGQALGEAFDMISSGDSDVVLTGGADSMINPFQVAGFCLLGALSSRKSDPAAASRPFDEDRDGFVLGEGACMFVFEDYDHAVKRGATIVGEIVGYGVTESAYRITDLHPEGRGTIEAMEMALSDAGIPPQKVGYINAHGTSTLLNDRIESLAIAKVFPSSHCKTVVSSTKSMTGHLISAAGAIEFAVAVYALQNNVIPPSVNLMIKDPNCEIELAGAAPSDLNSNFALSNSIGFGGSNTSLIARRFELNPQASNKVSGDKSAKEAQS